MTPGRVVCEGIRSGACVFTISQDFCVSVPVEFGAEATVGEAYVNCGGASAEDICTACDAIPVLPDTTLPDSAIGKWTGAGTKETGNGAKHSLS